ncbi:MAG TPA: NADH:flavin oxidoreductase, partial [Kofleriaceae bacterium]|nr:NADH:flavin oxidoreductase [Kofleriaceae bacterium]
VFLNRIALAPLTNGQSHADGTLGDAELAFLGRRADGGFGLVETCAAYVATDGKSWHGELGIDRNACVPGLTRLAARIHAGGARAFVQLFHGGARADRALTGGDLFSASAWTEGEISRRAATADDITRSIDAFVAAAVRAHAAGFDGIELHGAHGYLLSQFLSTTFNTRDDAWGGAYENRARLVREVTRRVRAAVPATFAVGVRLSLEDFGQAKGLDLDESLQLCAWLADDGADFLHVSLWDVTRTTTKRADEHALPLVRAAIPKDVAIFTAGKIWSHADAEAALAKGADIVALGRSAIVNPDWPRTADELRPPVTRAQLAERSVSPGFADYLTRWKGFITG